MNEENRETNKWTLYIPGGVTKLDWPDPLSKDSDSTRTEIAAPPFPVFLLHHEHPIHRPKLRINSADNYPLVFHFKGITRIESVGEKSAKESMWNYS